MTLIVLNVCSQIIWPSTFQGHMQMRGDSDSSLVVLWWSDRLGAIFDQIQPNLMWQIWEDKRNHISHRNPRFNSLTNSQEGRENWEDSEFDQFKSCTQGPDFSCQALAGGLKENSTLKNLDLQQNEIGAEGGKAWCLVRMVGKKRA